MSSMQAIALTMPGVLRGMSVPMPEVPDDGILMKTKAVSVCSTDVSYFHNHLFPQSYPIILGHEYVGQVTHVGRDSDPSLIGQRIVYFGQTDFGGFAEYRALRPLLPGDARISAFRTDRHFHDDERAAATIISDDLADIEAPLIEPVTAVLRAILTHPPTVASRILILGGGPCGAIAGSILKNLYGSKSITVIEKNAFRREKAQCHYADLTFASAEHLDMSGFAESTYDYIFDALPPLIDLDPERCPRRCAMRAAKPGSKYILYGASQILQQFDTWLLLAKGITLSSAAFDVNLFPMSNTSYIMKTAQKLILSGIVDPSWLCTRHLSFHNPDEILSFFENYRDEPALKAVVTFE